MRLWKKRKKQHLKLGFWKSFKKSHKITLNYQEGLNVNHNGFVKVKIYTYNNVSFFIFQEKVKLFTDKAECSYNENKW